MIGRSLIWSPCLHSNSKHGMPPSHFLWGDLGETPNGRGLGLVKTMGFERAAAFIGVIYDGSQSHLVPMLAF